MSMTNEERQTLVRRELEKAHEAYEAYKAYETHSLHGALAPLGTLNQDSTHPSPPFSLSGRAPEDCSAWWLLYPSGILSRRSS